MSMMSISPIDPSIRATIFSPDRMYRYALWREVDLLDSRYVLFICLNPSTAGELEDDPSVRRMVDFTKRWGFGALCVANLFAYCSTDPDVMKRAADPVGTFNDEWLVALASRASLVVAAWGKEGSHLSRADQVTELIPNLHCLVRNLDGSPRHPLYVRATTLPSPYP